MSPYSVTCPHCGRVFGYHPGQAGQVVGCAICGRPLQLPAAAPPAPVPPPPPPPPPVESFHSFAPEPVRQGPEPWYYGFVERYTKAVMWLEGLSLLLAAGVAFAVFGVRMMAGLREESGAAVVFGVLAILLYLAGLVVAFLAILFQGAILLMAVDAARNLRKLVAQGRQSR